MNRWWPRSNRPVRLPTTFTVTCTRCERAAEANRELQLENRELRKAERTLRKLLFDEDRTAAEEA